MIIMTKEQVVTEESDDVCEGCGRRGWINCRCGTGPTDYAAGS